MARGRYRHDRSTKGRCRTEERGYKVARSHTTFSKPDSFTHYRAVVRRRVGSDHGAYPRTSRVHVRDGVTPPTVRCAQRPVAIPADPCAARHGCAGTSQWLPTKYRPRRFIHSRPKVIPPQGPETHGLIVLWRFGISSYDVERFLV